MATPEANLSTPPRGGTDVNGNHTTHPSSARHLQNFNTFQFVSQLVSATPPYLFNMQSPFPGNFFSDLLRRMAPRAGTPGLPLDANLQQHIRAALMTKGTPPPNLPQSVMPPPLDLAALAAQHRHQQTLPPTAPNEKGVKRSLFTDVSALSSCDSENRAKRARLDEPRDERREQHPAEALQPPFLMQPPFLPTSLHTPPDILSPWSSRASLMRPQIPIPSHIPQASLDPYRLLLDLRLAGQLRTMAASHALHNKDAQLNYPSLGTSNNPANEITSTKDIKNNKDTPGITGSASVTSIRSDDSRVSAFHPPGRGNDAPGDTSEDEGGERRSNSRNSSNSSSSHGNKDVLGPQYILKNLNEIYQTINSQHSGSGDGENDSESTTDEKAESHKKSGLEPLSMDRILSKTTNNFKEISESTMNERNGHTDERSEFDEREERPEENK